MIAVAVILASIVASGTLATAEVALASSRRGRLKERVEAGEPGAREALALYEEPQRFLATVQVGITLICVLAGAAGGMVLTGPVSRTLTAWGVAPGWAAPAAFALVVAAIVALSLVLGERLPKRLALADPEGVAARLARPMTAVTRLAMPLTAAVSTSTELLSAPFGIRGRRPDAASPDVISGILQQGRRVGRIGWAEAEMIENVFDLEQRRVRSMITPRRDVGWLDADASHDEMRRALLRASHSRLPVARGELDRLVGVVHVHALLDRCLEGAEIDLLTMAEEPLVVPESISALALLERFRERGTRFAVVLDEYGGVEGVVTAGDVLSALLGELGDGTADDDPAVVRCHDGSFDLDGRLYLEEFKDLLDIAVLPREEERDYRTLGGMITTILGRIPRAGDDVMVDVWRFSVASMDGPRVERVHVAPGDAGDVATDAPATGGVTIGRPGEEPAEAGDEDQPATDPSGRTPAGRGPTEDARRS